jgi:hypothetical protein
MSQCAKLHVAGWTWAVLHGFSGEVYDFYRVSPEYFGFTLVLTVVSYRKNEAKVVWSDSL